MLRLMHRIFGLQAFKNLIQFNRTHVTCFILHLGIEPSGKLLHSMAQIDACNPVFFLESKIVMAAPAAEIKHPLDINPRMSFHEPDYLFGFIDILFGRADYRPCPCQIAVQAEGSEVEFRKLDLTPITKLSENN